MSLLVFNASNRIAQGVVKRLYGSGNFEKIVCADVYPNYFAIQRFINFKGELKGSNTKLTDIKAAERSELSNAIQECTHLLYVTHDYYTLTSSKLNLIKTTAELAKKNKNLKKFVALTPTEHDHYGETNPQEAAINSEREAQRIYPNLVNLKTDLTFGPHSTVAHSLLTRIVNGLGLAYNVASSGPAARPIHTDDVAAIVEAALSDDSQQGRSILLQGSENVSLGEYITALQGYAGKQFSQGGLLEKIISPSSANLLSERLYDPEYINLVRLLKNYKPIRPEGYETTTFGVSLQGLKSAYPERGIDEAAYRTTDSGFERLLKNQIY